MEGPVIAAAAILSGVLGVCGTRFILSVKDTDEEADVLPLLYRSGWSVAALVGSYGYQMERGG